MRPVQDVVLAPLGSALPEAKAVRDGHSWRVPGVVLEGAWQVGADGEVLIATTDDIPQEDMLHLVLLLPAGETDRASLGGAYATGSFRAGAASGDSLAFDFIGGTGWRVTVLPRPAWRLPLLGDPRGVSRPFGFRSRLRIDGAPHPEGNLVNRSR